MDLRCRATYLRPAAGQIHTKTCLTFIWDKTSLLLLIDPIASTGELFRLPGERLL
jgi:hypothetical protein